MRSVHVLKLQTIILILLRSFKQHETALVKNQECMIFAAIYDSCTQNMRSSASATQGQMEKSSHYNNKIAAKVQNFLQIQ